MWTYILLREIELAPLYLARERPVVIRDGMRIVADDPSRMRWRAGEEATLEMVRFRTLGCWPITAAEPSKASTMPDVFVETMSAKDSERRGRIGDGGSLERQKREGYF